MSNIVIVLGEEKIIMKKFVSVIALALLIPMAFAQEKKVKYVKSNVYENSVEMHYMRMLKVYAFEPSYSTIVRLTDDGKEVLFERMYDIANDYLASDLRGEKEVFQLQSDWQISKAYKNMDFTEYLLSNATTSQLMKIVSFGKNRGYSISDVLEDPQLYDSSMDPGPRLRSPLLSSIK